MTTVFYKVAQEKKPCEDVYINGLALSSTFPSCINPFSPRVPLGSIVCYSHTFVNNLGIKHKFTKDLKESCFCASDQHFSFKYLLKKLLLVESNPFWSMLLPARFHQNCQASVSIDGLNLYLPAFCEIWPYHPCSIYSCIMVTEMGS